MNPRGMIYRGQKSNPKKSLELPSNPPPPKKKIPGPEVNWNPQNSEHKKFPSTVNLLSDAKNDN